jgi:hypothetical protein
MENMESREWAVGMPQQEFNIEFRRRNPESDVIPDVRTWTQSFEVEQRGIDPFELENMILEQKVKPKEIKKEIPFCPGCKREFDHPKGAKLARAAHMKHCKVLLNTKL